MTTLRQLEMLVSLADCGRYHETARDLGVAQSAVTAQIKALETRLGARLVDRGRHGARLTPIGEKVVARARIVLAEVVALERLAREDAAQLGGLIRLGCLPTIGPYLLPLVTPALHARYPGLRMVIREASALDLEMALSDGSLDAIISTTPVSGTGVEALLLFSENVFLGMANDDPLSVQRVVAIPALRDRDLLTLGEGHPLGRLTLEFAEQAGARVRTDYLGSSLDALRQMIAMGTGLGLVPELYVRSEIDGRSDVVVRPLDSTRARRAIYLVWRLGSGREADYRQLAQSLSEAAGARLGRSG